MHVEYLLNSIYLQKIYPSSFREAHPLTDLVLTDIDPAPNKPVTQGDRRNGLLLCATKEPSCGIGKSVHLQANCIFSVIAKLLEVNYNHPNICCSVLFFSDFYLLFLLL